MAIRAMFSAVTLMLAGFVPTISCAEPQGPYPVVTLRIEGVVTEAENPALGVAGAIVELRHFKGLLTNPETLSRSTTGSSGHYVLTYSFTSVCSAQNNTTNWLVVSADGYDSQSTYTVPEFSNPVIYCTSESQVINLSLPHSQSR